MMRMMKMMMMTSIFDVVTFWFSRFFESPFFGVVVVVVSYGSLAAVVAIISGSATVSLMQCPSTSTHTGTGTHYADLGRMTG